MASAKDIQHASSSKPSQHRLSMNIGSLPKHARNHSHSVSSGSLNTSHRVSRRKSVSSNPSNAAMLAAVRAVRDAELTTSKKAKPAALGSLPSPPLAFQPALDGKADRGESAIEDDQNDNMAEDEESEVKLARRRASEGQYMKDGKKASGNDLKCDKCGKGYKHSSCLSKHLWEHTPEWSFTSKLLISKHQQVQLLEAASVLLTMNQDGPTPPDSAKDPQSDHDSASPAASGSSEHHDGTSSADTTPPPQGDMYNTYSNGSYTGRHKRYSSGFSRSYQSAPSANSMHGGSIPNGSGFGHYRTPSHERRPLSSGISRDHEDDGLAAAVELLSCSFGSTGKSRTIVPVNLPEDAPPVPIIPAQYLNQGSFAGAALTPSYPHHPESYTRHSIKDMDVKMEASEDSIADEDEYDHRFRSRSDEDDDGVFGRMEE